jgi:hypothetical protein
MLLRLAFRKLGVSCRKVVCCWLGIGAGVRLSRYEAHSLIALEWLSHYVWALRANKTIGTLASLYHVKSTGMVPRPTDQLLRYPIPKKAIEGFWGHICSPFHESISR